MKFCWTTIHVKNMDESLKFYKGLLNLELKEIRNPVPGIELAFLGSGETQVELICRKEDGDPSYGESISMGFEVPSLDNMVRLLGERGIPIHSGPFQPGPGIRFLYIQDPNGMKIQLVEFLKS